MQQNNKINQGIRVNTHTNTCHIEGSPQLSLSSNHFLIIRIPKIDSSRENDAPNSQHHQRYIQYLSTKSTTYLGASSNQACTVSAIPFNALNASSLYQLNQFILLDYKK